MFKSFLITALSFSCSFVCFANPDTTSVSVVNAATVATINDGVSNVAATANSTGADALVPDENEVIQATKPEKMYKLNWKTDVPVTTVGVLWDVWAFSKIYDKPNLTLDEVKAIDKKNVPAIDRWAAGMHSESASSTSDLFFYGSMPLPIVLLLDKKIRHDAPKVGFLYLEAMAVTGLLYTGCDYFIDRYRPEVYRVDDPGNLTSGNNKNSFFAGHVALVGTSTFFIAKVYHDYHPRTTMSYILWGGAIAATGSTIYLRHRAGKHFPTDLVVGTAVGMLSGIGIPALHKNKVFKKHGLSLAPAVMGEGLYGFSLSYRM